QDTLRQTLANREIAVLTVYPRGVGEIPWDKSFWKDTLRNAMHLGRTVDSMRLWDVLRSVDVLLAQAGAKPERLTVFGKGVSGALGLYAAILDPRIDQVMLLDPPLSHRQGPIFLNVLRYTDLPEAAELIAPRPLIFFGRVAPGFKGAVAMSIEPVLRGRFDHNFTAGY
ncbi:MAG: hypothetical protein HY238_06715, partial [Acidobacteria bacterium]|nr:hypothetical protein [Acidobacteriota bacterium]